MKTQVEHGGGHNPWNNDWMKTVDAEHAPLLIASRLRTETFTGANLEIIQKRRPSTRLERSVSSLPRAFPLSLAGIKVLVIDDDEAVLQVTCAMMQKLGMDPVGISSGMRGIEHVLVRADSIDLLFLDIVLADTSGFLVYERIRSSLPGLPIVLFSGYASRKAVQAILEQDPNTRFLAKPFAVGDIRSVVSMVD